MCYGVFTPDGTENFIYIECEHTILFIYSVSERCWGTLFSLLIFLLWIIVFDLFVHFQVGKDSPTKV